jgi:hypothetical protein
VRSLLRIFADHSDGVNEPAMLEQVGQFSKACRTVQRRQIALVEQAKLQLALTGVARLLPQLASSNAICVHASNPLCASNPYPRRTPENRSSSWAPRVISGLLHRLATHVRLGMSTGGDGLIRQAAPVLVLEGASHLFRQLFVLSTGCSPTCQCSRDRLIVSAGACTRRAPCDHPCLG